MVKEEASSPPRDADTKTKREGRRKSKIKERETERRSWEQYMVVVCMLRMLQMTNDRVQRRVQKYE